MPYEYGNNGIFGHLLPPPPPRREFSELDRRTKDAKINLAESQKRDNLTKIETQQYTSHKEMEDAVGKMFTDQVTSGVSMVLKAGSSAQTASQTAGTNFNPA